MLCFLLAAVLGAAPAPATEPTTTGSGITFVDDDLARALAAGRAGRKPVFVDAWATWCHSCLSMRSYVFPDPGLRPLRDAVVWAAVDTEQPGNREFVGAHRLDALPTFLVLEPDEGEVVSQWIGTATVAELREFVGGAVDAWTRRTSPDAASVALGEAWAASNRGDRAAAATAYERALGATPAGHPARPQRLSALAMSLAGVGTRESARRCAALGVRELASMGDTALVIDFASSTMGCAASLPWWDALTKRELRKLAITRLSELVKDTSAPLSVDDRSTAYAELVGWLDAAGRHDEAVARTRERVTLLEQAAASAPDVERAATFDAHRVESYLYLGLTPKAEQLLTARERELPDDYNPPARLARVLFKEGQLAAAEAAMTRALDKTPRGKRRVGFLDLQADILAAQGKPTSTVRRQQLELYRELPATQRSAQREEALEAALREAERADAGAAR